MTPVLRIFDNEQPYDQVTGVGGPIRRRETFVTYLEIQGWLQIVAGLLLLGFGLRGLSRYHRSVFWKDTVGTVTEVIEHRHPEFGMPSYQATVGFVDDTGWRRSFVNRHHVNDAVHYTVGEEVAVVYNPRKPGQAAIEGDLPSTLPLDIGFAFVGVCLLYAGAEGLLGGA